MAAAAVDLQNQYYAEEEMNDDDGDDTGDIPDSQSSDVSSANVDFWSQHTGLKVKQFSDEELVAFRKPFEMGWRREVVLRGTVTNSGRKIGDVYYFSPDKKIKLRSYVEMGLFLKKNVNCGLEPENFTFARQPIFEPPAEIVRPAMSRGSNQPADSQELQAPIQEPVPVANSTPVQPLVRKERDRSVLATGGATQVSQSQSEIDASLVEGRAKRKRVAPARFEDEDFAEQSPLKKKPVALKPEKIVVTGNQITPPIRIAIKTGIKSPMIVSANVIQLKKPLQPIAPAVPKEDKKDDTKPVLEIIKKEPAVSSAEESSDDKPTNGKSSTIPVVSETPPVIQPVPIVVTSTAPAIVTQRKVQAIQPKPKPSLLEKNLSQFKPIRPKPVPSMEPAPSVLKSFAADQFLDDGKALLPPCSIVCPGRQQQLPNLLCSRCLCLFHPQCVPTGIYLNEPHQFICPNCIQPTDKGSMLNTVNGRSEDESQLDVSSLSETSSIPKINGSRNSSRTASPAHGMSALKNRLLLAKAKGKSPQIKPRHFSQLNLLKNFQQQTCKKSYQSKMLDTDLLRGSLTGRKQHIVQKSGHLQVSNSIFRPGKSNSKSIIPPGLLSKGQHQQMSKIIHNQLQAFYQPTPIAPIAPIRVTPAQVASLLDKKIRNRYSEYLSKKNSGINRLTEGFSFLNNVLEYLSVKDLNSLKMVNRIFRSLASQSYLWKRLRLKGVVVKDWKSFGQNVVETSASVEVDFEGLKIDANMDIIKSWSSFEMALSHMNSVKILKFGTIPNFVVEELSKAVAGGNLPNLKSVSIRNIIHENPDERHADLLILNNFQVLTSLESLAISCKNGFKVNNVTIGTLDQVFSSLPKLTSLSLTNIKGLASSNFSFLKYLPHLLSLELGSCATWNKNVVENEEVCAPYKYLQVCRYLQELKLIELTLDKTSHLVTILSQMTKLKSLSLESVTVLPDAAELLDMAASVINDLSLLKDLSLSTNDPSTNRVVLQFLRKLKGLDHVTWKVGVVVEDSGECLVPFSEIKVEDGEDDLDNEASDVITLTEQLEDHLVHTKVQILPQ